MRTIIDIPDQQIDQLQTTCVSLGVSRAEVVRRAVSEFLERQILAKKDTPDAAFGIWKNRTDIGDSVDYQRKLRAEWD